MSSPAVTAPTSAAARAIRSSPAARIFATSRDRTSPECSRSIPTSARSRTPSPTSTSTTSRNFVRTTGRSFKKAPRTSASRQRTSTRTGFQDLTTERNSSRALKDIDSARWQRVLPIDEPTRCSVSSANSIQRAARQRCSSAAIRHHRVDSMRSLRSRDASHPASHTR